MSISISAEENLFNWAQSIRFRERFPLRPAILDISEPARASFRWKACQNIVGAKLHQLQVMLFMKLRPFLFQKQFVLFTKSYNSTPSVLVTANHHTDNGNSAPVHNGITTWIEVIFIFFLHFQNIQFLFTSGEVNETCLSTNVLHLLIFNE